MSALYSEDPPCETEIIFSALPTLEPATQPPCGNKREELPQHVQFLRNKLKQQQRRRQLIAKHEQALQQMQSLMVDTRTLNDKSETFNTQAAVLIGAVSKLQNELETRNSEQDSLRKELNQLRQQTRSLVDGLSSAKAHTLELNSDTASKNEVAGAMIEQLKTLLGEGRQFQADNQSAAQEVRQILIDSKQRQQDLVESVSHFRDLGEQAKQVIELAEHNLADTQEQATALKRLVNDNRASSDRFAALSDSMASLQRRFEADREEGRQINECAREQLTELQELAQRQTTMLELGNTQIESLRLELERALGITSEYESRLQATEEKLGDAITLQEKYRAQYEEVLGRLHSNEQIMSQASTALHESHSQNARFHDSLQRFQDSNEQSQQLLLRSQTSIEKLLSRNQALQENKPLNSESTDIPDNPSQAGHIQDLSAVDDLELADLPPAMNRDFNNRQGFYKLMMLLAIMLPLSFIAHSLISVFGAERVEASNVGYEIPFEPSSQSPPLQVDSPALLPNTASGSSLVDSTGRN